MSLVKCVHPALERGISKRDIAGSGAVPCRIARVP